MRRVIAIFILVCACIIVSVHAVENFAPTGETIILHTSNPKFEELLECESADELDVLLYPHMFALPTKYMEFATFNCTDADVEVSLETSTFLTVNFPDPDGIGYTNAEVIAAQLYVGLALIASSDESADYQEYCNQLSGFATFTTDEEIVNFIPVVTDVLVCQSYISEHKDLLSEESEFIGPLNLSGIPFSLGLSSRFDSDVNERDIGVYQQYWSSLTSRMARWGCEVTDYEYLSDINPFIYQEISYLPYPWMESEEDVISDSSSADAEVPLGKSGEFIPSEEVGIDGSPSTPVDYDKAAQDYASFVLSKNPSEQVSDSEPIETFIGDGKLRHYGLDDYLLALSLVVVVFAVIAACVVDWVRKRNDPLRNYPKWR